MTNTLKHLALLARMESSVIRSWSIRLSAYEVLISSSLLLSLIPIYRRMNCLSAAM